MHFGEELRNVKLSMYKNEANVRSRCYQEVQTKGSDIHRIKSACIKWNSQTRVRQSSCIKRPVSEQQRATSPTFQVLVYVSVSAGSRKVGRG
jgi:hypothetical protein